MCPSPPPRTAPLLTQVDRPASARTCQGIAFKQAFTASTNRIMSNSDRFSTTAVAARPLLTSRIRRAASLLFSLTISSSPSPGSRFRPECALLTFPARGDFQKMPSVRVLARRSPCHILTGHSAHSTEITIRLRRWLPRPGHCSIYVLRAIAGSSRFMASATKNTNSV